MLHDTSGDQNLPRDRKSLVHLKTWIIVLNLIADVETGVKASKLANLGAHCALSCSKPLAAA